MQFWYKLPRAQKSNFKNVITFPDLLLKQRGAVRRLVRQAANDSRQLAFESQPQKSQRRGILIFFAVCLEIIDNLLLKIFKVRICFIWEILLRFSKWFFFFGTSYGIFSRLECTFKSD